MPAVPDVLPDAAPSRPQVVPTGVGPAAAVRPAGVDPSGEADAMLDEARAEQRDEARRFVGMGLGIGVIGAATAAAFGAVCPVCVVAAPALLTIGLYKHVRAKRRG